MLRDKQVERRRDEIYIIITPQHYLSLYAKYSLRLRNTVASTAKFSIFKISLVNSSFFLMPSIGSYVTLSLLNIVPRRLSNRDHKAKITTTEIPKRKIEVSGDV